MGYCGDCRINYPFFIVSPSLVDTIGPGESAFCDAVVTAYQAPLQPDISIVIFSAFDLLFNARRDTFAYVDDRKGSVLTF